VSRTRKSNHPYAIKSLGGLISNMLAFLAILSTVAVRAQEPAKPASRSEATAIIANARKIVAPNGVERLEKVRIGGIDQWVSIRGADSRNPVLLYPRWPRIRFDSDELVVYPRPGGIFHGCPVGPARHGQDLSLDGSCEGRADTHTGTHVCRHGGNGRLGTPGVQQGQDIRPWPQLGQLSRPAASGASPRMAVRLYWRLPLPTIILCPS
jgi:hypothetical protein